MWLNDGTGTFIGSGQSLVDPISTDTRGVELGDVDGDGDLDAYVAYCRHRANEVWLNDWDVYLPVILKDR